MQHYGSAIELSFDFVFNIGWRDKYSTEVTGSAAAFAAPHTQTDGASQGSDVQPAGSWLIRDGCDTIRGGRRTHARVLVASRHVRVM
jgi:hypothetical protein